MWQLRLFTGLAVRISTKITPDRLQSKKLILSMDVDQKLLETDFSIANFQLIGDNWQSKTLFLAFLICVCWLFRML